MATVHAVIIVYMTKHMHFLFLRLVTVRKHHKELNTSLSNCASTPSNLSSLRFFTLPIL